LITSRLCSMTRRPLPTTAGPQGKATPSQAEGTSHLGPSRQRTRDILLPGLGASLHGGERDAEGDYT
jgi:hypothetical protein